MTRITSMTPEKITLSPPDYYRMRFPAGILFTLWLICGIQRTQADFTLNMNDQAFDDQYENCTEVMESRINSLLAEEKQADPEFSSTWDAAEKKWNTEKSSVPSGFRDEYGIAIMAYTNKTSQLYSRFNSAVRNYSGIETFHYHSLHFLMTRAVVLLRTSCRSPWLVYRGIKGIHFEPEKIGGEVRFGQFSSSSTNENEAEGFGGDTFFTFTSCFGAQIKNYSYYPKEEEVLIPVDEVFEVTNFTKQEGKNRFALKTTKRRCHYYNCDYLKKGGKSSTCVTSKGTQVFSSLMMIAPMLCQCILFK